MASKQSFAKSLYQFFKNAYIVFFKAKDHAYVFEGWGCKYLSRKYADRRTRISAVNKYCGGRMHYVLPVASTLVVLNSSEVQQLQNKNVLKKSLTIKDVLQMAYYVSDNHVSQRKKAS